MVDRAVGPVEQPPERLDGEQLPQFHPVAGLLLDLADRAVARVLAVIETAAGQGPEGRVGADQAGEQHGAVAQAHRVRADPQRRGR